MVNQRYIGKDRYWPDRSSEKLSVAISYLNYQNSYLIAAVSAIIKSRGSCDSNIIEISHSSQEDFSFRDLCYKRQNSEVNLNQRSEAKNLSIQFSIINVD